MNKEGGGYIYIFGDPNNKGSYKIGRAKNVEKRKAQLEVERKNWMNNPKPLILEIKIRVKDFEKVEKEFHDLLHWKHDKGEIFKLDDGELGALKRILKRLEIVEDKIEKVVASVEKSPAKKPPASLDIAEKILKESEPLDLKTLYKRIMEAGWETHGKTPKATISANFLLDMRKPNTRFARTSDGKYTIKNKTSVELPLS